jgi:hypothetical protein
VTYASSWGDFNTVLTPDRFGTPEKVDFVPLRRWGCLVSAGILKAIAFATMRSRFLAGVRGAAPKWPTPEHQAAWRTRPLISSLYIKSKKSLHAGKALDCQTVPVVVLFSLPEAISFSRGEHHPAWHRGRGTPRPSLKHLKKSLSYSERIVLSTFYRVRALCEDISNFFRKNIELFS